MVITELPQDDAKKALEMLCLPVVTHLQVSSASTGFNEYHLLVYYNINFMILQSGRYQSRTRCIAEETFS